MFGEVSEHVFDFEPMLDEVFEHVFCFGPIVDEGVENVFGVGPCSHIWDNGWLYDGEWFTD